MNAMMSDSARSGLPGMPRLFRSSLLSISVSPLQRPGQRQRDVSTTPLMRPLKNDRDFVYSLLHGQVLHLGRFSVALP
jgi:hypothetical protein